MNTDALEKTTRMNLLFDYYADLLTEKQRKYLQYYFHDNYSLAEIAEAFQISRQAVYEHIRRAEAMLEQYEQYLQLAANDAKRAETIEEIEQTINRLDIPARDKEALARLIERLKNI